MIVDTECIHAAQPVIGVDPELSSCRASNSGFAVRGAKEIDPYCEENGIDENTLRS